MRTPLIEERIVSAGCIYPDPDIAGYRDAEGEEDAGDRDPRYLSAAVAVR